MLLVAAAPKFPRPLIFPRASGRGRDHQLFHKKEEAAKQNRQGTTSLERETKHTYMREVRGKNTHAHARTHLHSPRLVTTGWSLGRLISLRRKMPGNMYITGGIFFPIIIRIFKSFSFFCFIFTTWSTLTRVSRYGMKSVPTYSLHE